MQKNQGAVFPRYDELQVLLSSPGKEKASKETVSRVLLMLRITGWLSLFKRVRDEKGRVRGNIYAQHDEPLTFLDAELLDPGWLDIVVEACHHTNRTISRTALAVLMDIKEKCHDASSSQSYCASGKPYRCSADTFRACCTTTAHFTAN